MDFNDDNISFTGNRDEMGRKIYDVTMDFDVTDIDKLLPFIPNEYLEAIKKEQVEHENYEAAAKIKKIIDDRK